MRNVAFFFGILLLLMVSGASAQNVTREEMRSLDEQVQDIKSDVLGIAAELNRLEERLLFPSNTQVGVFVAVAQDSDFRLDAVQVRINGELVAHYIYSFNELEALRRGGVQRIYTGNLRSGEHALQVAVSGVDGGRDFSHEQSFTFVKDIEPRVLGITLAAPGSRSSAIELANW